MSLSAQSEAATRAAAAPQPKEEPKGRSHAWFGWWVAVCLVALAVSSYQQLQIQRRILVTSRLLETKLAESKAISASMNDQLVNVAQLDDATRQLNEKLKRVVTTNRAIRDELTGMESTVNGIRQAVGKLDQQAVASHQLLAEVARQSTLLSETLARSYATGAEVSGRISLMVELQEAVNADMAEMDRKTRPLERFTGR
jgi:septal ring factor EnvC (AmiA/AmiB activator)